MQNEFKLDPEHLTAESFAAQIQRAHQVEVDADGQTCVVTYENTKEGRLLAHNDRAIFSGVPGVLHATEVTE